MCGRFGSSFTGEDLLNRFDLAEKSPSFNTSYNIAPSFTIPIITRNSPNKAVLAKWGFLPVWADPVKFKLKPINARADQVATNGFYKDAFKDTRCLIPFSWFYEWKKYTLDGKAAKQPYLIRVKGESLMGFAGIYSEKIGAEGESHLYCAIITTEPNTLMKTIHDRMPVILHKKGEDKWLDHESTEKELVDLLKPFEASKMEAYRVSQLVNSPKNDGKEIFEPIK